MVKIHGVEGGTCVVVKPFEMRLLIGALDTCRKDEECSFGWGKDVFDNFICSTVLSFEGYGKPVYYPELVKECLKKEKEEKKIFSLVGKQFRPKT